jgi:hypothetical protein
MNALNNAFFFVTDKIIALQQFFWTEAWAIGRIVLFIAIISAAINYAITGEGLKNNIIKIGKALVFFIVIMWAYPWIISHITEWTFNKAMAAAYDGGLQQEIELAKEEIALSVETAASSDKKTPTGYERFMRTATTSPAISESRDPREYFSEILVRHVTSNGKNSYWTIAPQAALGAVMLVAGGCIDFADTAPKGQYGMPDMGRVIKGYVCAFFVILTGVFAVLEYVIAFIEYMFVTSVGIILFPLSMWEGTKFMAEKLISAIIGFFIKLLFCTICIFLMLYGFFTLARLMSASKFMGTVDQILMVIFVSLLFFYLCKSAPGLAQSLLTGTPSLSAAGAIGAMGSAIAAATMTKSLVQKGGSALAGGAAKGIFAGAGMLSQADEASQAVKASGGSNFQALGAGLSSIRHSAGEALKSGGGDLARSLLGGGASRTGGGGTGVNRHSQLQSFSTANADGTKKTFGEQIASRREQGAAIGRKYLGLPGSPPPENTGTAPAPGEKK